MGTVMQRELPLIHFATQAEVRSQAEYRRSEELAELLTAFFGRWTAKLRGRRPVIFGAANYAQMPAGARALPPGRG
jgi:hypothetical protein